MFYCLKFRIERIGRLSDVLIHNPKKCDQFLYLNKRLLLLRIYLQLRHNLKIDNQKYIFNLAKKYYEYCIGYFK